MKHWTCILSLTSLLTTFTAHAEQASFDATIPVLDMNEYFQPDTKDHFVSQLYNALKEVGFFAVINTGVDPETLDTGYQSIFDFFALPQEEKLKVFAPETNGQRGYVPGESAKGQAVGDFKEFYHIGRERSAEQTKALNAWDNVWPSEFSLKDPLNRLFKALEQYKFPLEQAMAEAIGVSSDFLTSMTNEGDVLMRAIHYPANPPANTVWAAEHTDIDLFTILPRSTAEGLQVLNKNGEWIDVRVPANAFVINGGDMLENLTNGEFRSGLHRVVAKNDGYERFSIVYFVHPRAKDRLDPLPICIERTGGVRKYSNATRIELLAERLTDLGLASFDMMKELAESGLMERQLEVGRASPSAMTKLRELGLASDTVLAELARIEQMQ